MRQTTVLLVVALAACATAGRKPMREVDQELPSASEVKGSDATDLAAARAHEAKGDAAGAAHDQARIEWGAAASRYRALAQRPSMAAWRVPLGQRAAALFLRAQRWEAAAETAQAIVADEQAGDTSRAIGARLAATAWLGAANAAVKAGQLEKLDLATEGKERARPPPPGWQRVLDAADAYLARAGADPDAGRAAPGRGPSAGELALVAAEVRYAFGDVEDARRRLDAALARWPADAELIEQAVPLYLATFLARGDQAGYAAALETLRGRITAEAAKDPARNEALKKQLDALSRAQAGARFSAAEELMRKGKPAEAASAFEGAAAGDAAGAANALHNAAVAWDAAGEPDRAAAARERLLKEHAEATVTAEDALRLAAFRSRQGDHAAAARLYDEFLRRWPQSPSRCIALRNVASELDRAEQPLDAASRYLSFGTERACNRADPDIAARALVRGGHLFEAHGNEAQSKKAYSAAVVLERVTDPQARKDVAEAKRRLKGN